MIFFVIPRDDQFPLGWINFCPGFKEHGDPLFWVEAGEEEGGIVIRRFVVRRWGVRNRDAIGDDGDGLRIPEFTNVICFGFTGGMEGGCLLEVPFLIQEHSEAFANSVVLERPGFEHAMW